MSIGEAKNDLMFQILMKVSSRINGDDFEFLRDQIETVLYNYDISKIENTELSCNNDGKTTCELLDFFRIGKLASGRKESTVNQYL